MRSARSMHDLHVVLDQEHGRLPCYLAYQRPESLDLAVGQALRRLVEDQ